MDRYDLKLDNIEILSLYDILVKSQEIEKDEINKSFLNQQIKYLSLKLNEKECTMHLIIAEIYKLHNIIKKSGKSKTDDILLSISTKLKNLIY